MRICIRICGIQKACKLFTLLAISLLSCVKEYIHSVADVVKKEQVVVLDSDSEAGERIKFSWILGWMHT